MIFYCDTANSRGHVNIWLLSWCAQDVVVLERGFNLEMHNECNNY